jgi:hypothetical protein
VCSTSQQNRDDTSTSALQRTCGMAHTAAPAAAHVVWLWPDEMLLSPADAALPAAAAVHSAPAARGWCWLLLPAGGCWEGLSLEAVSCVSMTSASEQGLCNTVVRPPQEQASSMSGGLKQLLKGPEEKGSCRRATRLLLKGAYRRQLDARLMDIVSPPWSSSPQWPLGLQGLLAGCIIWWLSCTVLLLLTQTLPSSCRCCCVGTLKTNSCVVGLLNNRGWRSAALGGSWNRSNCCAAVLGKQQPGCGPTAHLRGCHCSFCSLVVGIRASIGQHRCTAALHIGS